MCKRRTQRTHQGFVFITALYMTSVIALALLASMTQILTEVRSSEQYVEQKQVFHRAEAAIDVAIVEFISGGTDQTVNFSQTENWADADNDPCNSGENCFRTVSLVSGGTATVRIDDIGVSEPVITSTSSVQGRQQRVEVVASIMGPQIFQQAIFGDVEIEIGDSGISLVDSYDSSQGAYTPAPAAGNRTEQGHIRTNSTEADSLELEDVNVHGDVLVGTGGDPAVVIDDQGGVTISGTQTAASSNLTLDPVTVPLGVSNSGDLEVDGGSMVLSAGKYWYDEIEIKGGATFLTSGKVTIYVTEELQLEEGSQMKGQVGGYDKPSALQILFLTSEDGEVELKDGTFVGTIYAPSAEVEIGPGNDEDDESTGSMQVYGAILANDVEMKNSEFHYDTALADEYLQIRSGPAIIRSWRQP